MVSPQRSDGTAHADALLCLSAVQLMRARRNAGVAGGDVPPVVDSLLSVVRLELATDPESVPPPIRDAAVQLAAYLVQRFRVTPLAATSRPSTPGQPAVGPPELIAGRLSRSPRVSGWDAWDDPPRRRTPRAAR